MITRGEQLVDVHSHFVTPDYVEAARAAGHTRPDGMPGYPDWSADRHLRLMDEHGIRVSVLSLSSPGTHFGDDADARALSRRVNEFAAEVVRDRPDRFGHFASLPLPDVDGALAELTYALDELAGFGVVVETNAHGRYLGHPDFTPLWEELDRRGGVVFVHPTSPPAFEQVALDRPRPMLEFVFDSTRTVSDLVFGGVLQRYPRIQWIVTHGGGALPLLADRIQLFRSTFLGDDTARPASQLVGELWFDMAGTPFPNQVPALVRMVGTSRLLYGSDYCWTPAAAVAAQLTSIDRTTPSAGETWRALTTRNALLLMPGLAT